MLKPHKLCNVCRVAESNPKLIKDIYNSSFFMKGSSITLRSIFQEYQAVNGAQFSYEALLNHVKKHQFMSEKDFSQRHMRQIAKTAEKQMLMRTIESKEVWDEVINKGMEKLANGEMPMKTADLLKAAKDKSDFELKTKDQQLAMMEMVMHFASGENNESRKYDRRVVEGKTAEDYDPTVGTAADSDEGEARPSGIYYPPAWDAVTPGADSLPASRPDF